MTRGIDDDDWQPLSKRTFGGFVDWLYLWCRVRIDVARRHQALLGARMRARVSGASIEFSVHPTVRFAGRCRFEVQPGTANRVVIGPRTRLGHEVQVNLRGGTVELGADIDIRRFCSLNVEGVFVMGDRSVLSNGVFVHCAESVTIGSATGLSEYVTIADSNHVRTPREIPFQQEVRTAPVTIGDNVWIGSKAVITAGVDIGDLAFIGANSVVTRSVEPLWLAAGIPAEPVRKLTVESNGPAGDSAPHEPPR